MLDGLKAISEENGGQVILVPEETPEMAAALAEEADVSVLVLGGSSSRFNSAVFDKNGAAIVDGHSPMDCGEGVDLSSLQLSKKQLELSKAVFAASKKTVTVVIAGRPYDIADIDRQTDALIYSFYPGPKGGTALAEIIFGKEAPSGRLPVSLPGKSDGFPFIIITELPTMRCTTVTEMVFCISSVTVLAMVKSAIVIFAYRILSGRGF